MFVWRTFVHNLTRCPRDNMAMVICFYSVLHYLLLFLCVCLPVFLSLQTAFLKLLFFFPPSLSLSLPRTRSQSLRDGPVSARFWTQWGRSQPQKPLGPRAQRNSKRHQPVTFSSTHLTSVAKFLAERNHSEAVWFFAVHSSPLLIHTSTVLRVHVELSICGQTNSAWRVGWMLISLQSSLQRAWQASKQL